MITFWLIISLAMGVALHNLALAISRLRKPSPLNRLQSGSVALASSMLICALASLSTLFSANQRDFGRIAQSRWDIQTLKAALSEYHRRYGRWPTVQTNRADVTLDISSAEFSSILAGARSSENPDGFAFLFPGVLERERPRLDPWGGHYYLTIDGNGDGKFEVILSPNSNSCVVWSESLLLQVLEQAPTTGIHNK